MSDRVCPICGKSFQRTAKRIVYCSDECATQGHKEKSSAAQKVRVAKRRADGKTCPVCGKKFTPEDPKQKYCSKECYKVVFKRQCKEYHERKKNGEPARKKWETVGDKRPCHGCGKPSYNYWCPACWRKRAQKYGIPEEDVPGGRWYNEEVENG